RLEFVAAHPNLFLVIALPEENEEIEFQTRVVTPEMMKRGSVASPNLDLIEVLEVSKAPGNPYPERISVGRARNCDVVMRDPSVSKLHAHMRLREAGKLDLIDLESQNGTRINGRALAPHTPEWVAAGDELRCG